MLRFRKNYRSMSWGFIYFGSSNLFYGTIFILTIFAVNLIAATPVGNVTENAGVSLELLSPLSSSPSPRADDGLGFDNKSQCLCEPPCLNEKELSCPFNRTVLRTDCTCCTVCARQIGQSCNNHVLVCDNELGLTCDNDTNTCSGPFNLRAFNVTHNSTVLKWRSSAPYFLPNDSFATNFSLFFADQLTGTNTTEWKPINLSSLNDEQISIDQLSPNKLFYFRLTNESESNSDNFEILVVHTKDGCLFENSSVGVGERYTVGCELKCLCEENGSSTCSSRCPPMAHSLHPLSSSSNSDCKEVVDPQDNCCKILSCEQREGHSLTGEPQVIVTGRSPDSLTIAWDDFKVPGPTFDQGYVVEYRPVVDDKGQNFDWKTVNVEHGPFTTIGNLTPNTAYEIRVFIWEDVETEKYGPSTDTIVLSTEDGCIWDSKALTVGESYNKGCVGRCICLGDNNSECGPRCSPPYFTKGISANDSSCIEEPLFDDKCCVLLLCLSKSDLTTITSTQTTTTISEITTTIGLTSTTTLSTTEQPMLIGECPVSVTDTSSTCNSNCKTDTDCAVGKRCCLSDCGSQICVSTSEKFVIVSTTTNNPCTEIKCGPNAVCHSIEGEGRCFCLPGTSGNPNDVNNGCLQVITSGTQQVDLCAVKACGPNAVCHQYKGESRCYCLPGASGNPDDVENGCIKVSTYFKEKEKAKTGCSHGNASYAVGEIFYSGCDDKCECVKKDDNFEVVCQPRCPRQEEKFIDETVCHYQVDPNDDCCKILVCQQFNENAAEKEVIKNESSGCEYKGKAYKSDEHFYDGCELSCYCIGAGEVTCNPRCPPLSESKPGCISMPHPSDSECCTLIICNPFNLNFTLPSPTLDDEDNPVVGSNNTVTNATALINETIPTNGSSLLEDELVLDSIGNENSTVKNSLENATTLSTEPDGMETSLTIIHSNNSSKNSTNLETLNTSTEVTTEKTDLNSTDDFTSSKSTYKNVFNASEDDLASFFEDEEDTTSQDNITQMLLNDGNVTSSRPLLNETSSVEDNSTTSVLKSNDTAGNETLETSTVEVEFTTEDGENTTGRHKEVRLLQDVDSQAVEFPKSVGRLADIHRILLIDPTTARMQILLAPSIMEKIFMDSDLVFVLYTNNLTHVDLVNWERHPLSLQHNLAFVSVDRSDIAAETIITDLEPNRQYNFVVVIQKENVDPDNGFQFKQLSEIEATVTVRLGDGMCEFMGKSFNIGDRLYDECQAVCDCVEGPNGQMVICEAIICPSQINPEKSGCLEWNVDLSFIPRAPHCCPDATCKFGSMCLYKGKRFRNLAKIPQSLVDDCEQECTCVAGNVTCISKCPPVGSKPSENDCDGTLELRTTPGDYCCKYWHCVKKELATNNSINVTGESSTVAVPHVVETTLEIENITGAGAVNESTIEHENKTITPETEISLPQPECIFENGTYKLNEQWRVGKGHRQKLCTCLLMRNGTAGVECQGGCPTIVKQPDELIPHCPPENVVVWDVPESDLCPYLACNKSDVGRGVTNVTVDTLNATAIRVTFIIPNIYVGLYGQIEILYTMDLTHSDDTTTWNKEVFSGPSNQFQNTRLSHEITGLQPDTEYYLKVLVVTTNTKNMDSSEIITVRMPPLPTTTTTTTTTTLPPKIHLDPQLSVSDITTTSAKIRWRGFDASEKRYVDGVQLHYKLHNDDTQQWSQTLLIHRDLVFYDMEHLKPNSEYDVTIVIVTSPNVSTEIMVGEPITFKTLAVFDDYEFNLTLTVDKTTPYSIDLIWTGVPYPEHKYVNVYRFLYKKMNNKDTEASFIYQSPKINQFQFKVENLMPETNYTIWMEALLTNGKVRSSNVITVPTKPGSLIANQSEKETLKASTENIGKNGGNTYYAALIVVAVIATVCALGFVILLVILLRKQSSAKAPITSTKSHSAYDNPTYKDSLD